jgi:hypothetical protein
MANNPSTVNIAAAPAGIIQPSIINAASSLENNRTSKRPRVQECRAVTIARQAREDDALYRALLVRILKDHYMDGDDNDRIRKDYGTAFVGEDCYNVILAFPLTASRLGFGKIEITTTTKHQIIWKQQLRFLIISRGAVIQY